MGLDSPPAVATALHGVAIWLRHVPRLFEAALTRGFLHYAQHASFLVAAQVFWRVMLPSRETGYRLGTHLMHLFLTSLHTSVPLTCWGVALRRQGPGD